MQKQEPIIEKIKKLYQKAESARELGNVQEAEAFILKVTELLNKHNLEESVLQDKDKEDISHTEKENCIFYYKTPYNGLWETDFIAILAEMNYCKALYNDFFKRATIVGKPHNIEVVKYLYEFAEPLFSRLAAESYETKVKETREQFKIYATSKENAKLAFQEFIAQYVLNEAMGMINAIFGNNKVAKQQMEFLEEVSKLSVHAVADDFMPSSYADNMKDVKQVYYVKNLNKFKLLPDRGVFIRSFLIGVPIGVYRKYEEQISKVKRDQEREAEEARKANQENVVPNLHAVILSSKQEVEAYVEQKWPNLKSIATNNAGDAGAFQHGIKTGQSTNLGLGLNTGNGTATKKLN